MSSVPLELEVASIVVEHLDELAADRGISRDSLIERVLRLGLDKTDQIRREHKPFRMKARDMGQRWIWKRRWRSPTTSTIRSLSGR